MRLVSFEILKTIYNNTRHKIEYYKYYPEKNYNGGGVCLYIYFCLLKYFLNMIFLYTIHKIINLSVFNKNNIIIEKIIMVAN